MADPYHAPTGAHTQKSKHSKPKNSFAAPAPEGSPSSTQHIIYRCSEWDRREGNRGATLCEALSRETRLSQLHWPTFCFCAPTTSASGKLHRTRIKTKVGVQSVAELVQLAQEAANFPKGQ